MQPNSEKQDYTKQDNNYSSEGVSPSYQTAPPPYAQYSQQPIGGAGYASTGRPYISQAPLYQQKGIVVVPVQRRQFFNIRVITPITTSLRMFLWLSGFLYALWGIISFSLQLAITVNSDSTYYHGFWTGFPFIVAGILMMVIGFRPAFPLAQLMRTYCTAIIFCTLGFVLSMINYAISDRCPSISHWNCDYSLVTNLKLGLMIIFSLSFIHTILNMVYISKEQKQAISASNLNIVDC